MILVVTDNNKNLIFPYFNKCILNSIDKNIKFFYCSMCDNIFCFRKCENFYYQDC